MFKGVKKNLPLCWEWESKGKYILDDGKNVGTRQGRKAQYSDIVVLRCNGDSVVAASGVDRGLLSLQ
jgi:hypothetical protein